MHILTELFRAPEKLRSINMVSPGDKMRLLEKPAYMRTPYERVCIDRIIDRYAVWKQKETAVCWGDGMSLTYEEVKMHADSLAWRLNSKGVMHGDVVAFMPRRNGTMLVAMLGILKAGAAYLPIDAAFPKERVEYMLSTCRRSPSCHRRKYSVDGYMQSGGGRLYLRKKVKAENRMSMAVEEQGSEARMMPRMSYLPLAPRDVQRVWHY